MCKDYYHTFNNFGSPDLDPDVKDRPDHDSLINYLLMGGSVTLVLGTIITVITSYYLCYYRKKKRGKMQNVDYNKKSV